MLLVSLLSLLLRRIGQPFFAYVVIFREPSFKDFSFPQRPYWNYVLILMLIELATPYIISLAQGFVSFLETLLFFWKSKKQDIVSRSSTKVEYRVMASTATEIFWLRWLLYDMCIILSELTSMCYDNKSIIQIDHNSVFHERTKHIEIDCHCTRHHLQHETITLSFDSSSLQVDDLFTKMHFIKHFCFLIDKLPMLPTNAFSV